jgi:hypothetical protein
LKQKFDSPQNPVRQKPLTNERITAKVVPLNTLNKDKADKRSKTELKTISVIGRKEKKSPIEQLIQQVEEEPSALTHRVIDQKPLKTQQQFFN